MNLPDLPLETAQAAVAAYPEANVYFRLGQNLPVFFHGLDLATLEYGVYLADPCGWRKALVAVFQYRETFTDQQAAFATGQWLDWKFALRLPLAFSGFVPVELHEFRVCLLKDRAGLAIFQTILDRLITIGFIKGLETDRDRGITLLRTVNVLSRNQKLADLLSRAIEAMAINQPEILRRIAKPHWYMRYRHSSVDKEPTIESCKQLELACSLREDALYLLSVIKDVHEPSLSSLLEIQSLTLMCEKDPE